MHNLLILTTLSLASSAVGGVRAPDTGQVSGHLPDTRADANRRAREGRAGAGNDGPDVVYR
jgi:hypothetical protein